MGRIERREFLKKGLNAGLLAGGSVLMGGCPGPAPFLPTAHAARVAAIRGTDLADMARDALDAFGGAGAIVNPGERVFIKPNFGGVGMVRYNPITEGDSTKPEIVLAVVEECLKAGAREVLIGEAGQVPGWDWNDVYTLDGAQTMREAVERLNRNYRGRAVLSCLNSESPGWDPVPSYNACGFVRVTELMMRADKVISLPVLKTHRWTQITGAMKNFVGVTPLADYGVAGVGMRVKLHQQGIEQSFLDIVRAVQPDFTITDCSICCEGNGPHVLPGYWGTTVDMRERLGDWLLLASTDLAAADATAARVISHEPAEINHLQMAYDQGLGQILEEKIELVGENLDSLRVYWEPAEQTQGFLEVLIPGFHLLTDSR
ncbi:MAG: DUF362 domain-containing protein [Candidatus Hydrogenedentales bacterium]|jgi:uncharacterized protein (DUF362 family)